MFIEYASRGTGLGLESTRKLIRSASHRYKEFSVPKRSGSGWRTIAQPSREIKLLQRWSAVEVISRFPVHSVALGYVKRTGIRRSATTHAGNRFLLRLDFANFFPSLSAGDIRSLCARNESVLRPHIESQADVENLCSLVCRFGTLAIGAPSSPPLSNALMYDFDAFVTEACRRCMVAYSRYADDLYFSSNSQGALRYADRIVADALRACPGLRLRLNAAKRVSSSKKGSRRVLGLVLTPQGGVSLGRTRKRTIRTLVFRATKGRVSPEEAVRLNGLLAFASSVEPEFISRLRRYEGESLISSGVRLPSPPGAQRRQAQRSRARGRGAGQS